MTPWPQLTELGWCFSGKPIEIKPVIERVSEEGAITSTDIEDKVHTPALPIVARDDDIPILDLDAELIADVRVLAADSLLVPVVPAHA